MLAVSAQAKETVATNEKRRVVSFMEVPLFLF
jgi:hypothetical protein